MYFRIPIVILFIVTCLAGFVVFKGSIKDTPVANGYPLEAEIKAEVKETAVEPGAADLTEANIALNSITARDLRAHVEFLSDDLLEGRDTNSRGIRVAGRYIASHFERCGLQPVGENNTFYQPVKLKERTILPSSQVFIEVDDEMIPLKYGEDFLVSSFPGKSGVKITSEMVFSGFGINAEEYKYNDYENISVKNKISVYVAGEPYLEGDPTFFNGKLITSYSRIRAKKTAAKNAGASAAIAISTTDYLDDYNWRVLTRYFENPDIDLEDKVYTKTLPLITLHPKAAELILAGSEKSYAELDSSAARGDVPQFKIGKKAEINVKFKTTNFTDNNVVGYLVGSDPELKSEVIVIGAHYDHVGIGTTVEGDSIYNGASDNASGTSSIMELAEAFSKMPQSPRRSILFIAYTAEEKGLLGSEYYVNNPIFPLSKTVANFNIDMIGIGDSTAIMLIGEELSSLGKLLRETSEQMGLTVLPDRMPEQRLFYRSDHYSFAKKGIPAIFPSFTMEPSDFSEFRKYYHKPQDEVTWSWFNFNTMEKQIKSIFLAVLSVANADNLPEWETGVEFSKYRNNDN